MNPDDSAAAAQELDSPKRIEMYHKMQQQAWDDSSLVLMLQQKNVAPAQPNVAGFHLGPQSDFIRYDNTRKS